jgi:hypothetical protein
MEVTREGEQGAKEADKEGGVAGNDPFWSFWWPVVRAEAASKKRSVALTEI